MRSNGSMGLVIWDQPSDFYNHTDLEHNWDAVEAHDHTPGKGVQLQTNSLANNSVTGAKIAPNSINSGHIIDGTIQGVDIGDGQVGYAKLDPAVFTNITPLGTVTAWFRPVDTIPVPTGWVICDGSVVTSALHGWTGVGNVSVPNLVGKFVHGAGLTGTGTTPDLPPAENAVGGLNSRIFNHSHTIPGHSHTVNAHSHSLPMHSHTINVDGQHNHGIHSRMNAFDGEYIFTDATTGTTHAGDQQSLYVAGFNTGQVDHALPAIYPPNDGAHSHGARTGDSAGQTSSDSTGTSSTSLTTDSTGAGGDIRPAYVGLLYIVKIRHA